MPWTPISRFKILKVIPFPLFNGLRIQLMTRRLRRRGMGNQSTSVSSSMTVRRRTAYTKTSWASMSTGTAEGKTTKPASNLWNSRPHGSPAAPHTPARTPDNIHDQLSRWPLPEDKVARRTRFSRESHETHHSCPRRHVHLPSAHRPGPARAPAHHRHRARPLLFHRSSQVA